MAAAAPLDILKIADPDTYVRVKGRVALIEPPPFPEALALLAQETIWGLSLETGFGQAYAEGQLQLMSSGAYRRLRIYSRLVRRAAETGATLGRIMAVHLVPVVLAGDVILDQFKTATAVMLRKGAYTLKAPLETLDVLIKDDDLNSASTYLSLLKAAFEQKISYNQSLRLVYQLPKAVRSFTQSRRDYQMQQMQRLIKTDLKLVDPFLEGMEKGLGLLDADALSRFVDRTISLYHQNLPKAHRFLSLTAKAGQDACADLQLAVPLAKVKAKLNRYLQARLGRSVQVLPLSHAFGKDEHRGATVSSDGNRAIYVVEEIQHFNRRSRNFELYKTLIRLEAGFFEYGSFDFDLERAADQYPAVRQWVAGRNLELQSTPSCDALRFVSGFAMPVLADDLFTLFEQGRVMRCMARDYPGLMQRCLPLLQTEMRYISAAVPSHCLLWPLYARVVLSMNRLLQNKGPAVLQTLEADYHQRIDSHSSVEASAEMVCLAYEALEKHLAKPRRHLPYTPLITPFGRKLHWDLVSRGHAQFTQFADMIKFRLADQKLKVYRSDLARHLADTAMRIDPQEIETLVFSPSVAVNNAAKTIDWSRLDLASLIGAAGISPERHDADGEQVYRYPEWDNQLQDYLKDHTRVREIEVPEHRDEGFYQKTLLKHSGMVVRIRRAFELLKPEAITMLRQWPEGDDFDYRALLDYVVDRRAGHLPSERLFIKRLKKERDVAVMLLVDLSRSTANRVAGGHTTVLNVAKEALVIFCEALQVVGDTFAIAGFSGSGRHGVDYYCIKGFGESLRQGVQGRISGLQPQRSTRMGAAVRHATARLNKVSSRVRLLIIVSDGFPNDLGYKADYAIADSRRAIQEARALNFHVKAITVQIGSDPLLDDLYGRLHHHVIGDVQELPDKLLRLYGTLTRS